MEKALALQLQIRQNAEEISSTLSDMTSWEKKMREKDTLLRRGQPLPNVRARKVTREGGTVKLNTTSSPAISSKAITSGLTPATIIDTVTPQVPSSSSASAVPSARGRYEQRDLEEAERELGNAEFKAGNFSAAVKSYTKCLGLKSNNYIGFSNRAMAYLKLKEYHRAVLDSDCALKIDPTHVKSLLRRATGLNALGKHRAALQDLHTAQELEPSNKQVRSDISQTRELLRAAVNRTPHSTMRSYEELLALHEQHRTAVSTQQISTPENGEIASNGMVKIDIEEDGVVQGPDPLPASFMSASSSNNHAEAAVPPAPPVVTPSSNEEKGSVRIPISLNDDDDNDDEVQAADRPATSTPTSSLSSSTQRITISGVDSDDEEDAEPSSSNPSVTPMKTEKATKASTSSTLKISTVKNTNITGGSATTSKSKTSAKASGTSKKASSSPKKTASSNSLGAYELEKALVQAQGDIAALHAILVTLQPSKDASRIFQTVVEPEAMVLLLDAVWLVIQSLDPVLLPPDSFWQWCYALQACSSFSLLYSLVSRNDKTTLQERLRSLAESQPWSTQTKKMQTVLTKFDCSV